MTENSMCCNIQLTILSNLMSRVTQSVPAYGPDYLGSITTGELFLRQHPGIKGSGFETCYSPTSIADVRSMRNFTSCAPIR
jgi:hypothetical protein